MVAFFYKYYGSPTQKAHTNLRVSSQERNSFFFGAEHLNICSDVNQTDFKRCRAPKYLMSFFYYITGLRPYKYCGYPVLQIFWVSDPKRRLSFTILSTILRFATNINGSRTLKNILSFFYPIVVCYKYCGLLSIFRFSVPKRHSL